ncbi:MAG: hypothetical protein H0V72_28920 [Bradyrhizobium sp.]|nr:hypothetical protein [Bradyrhizobium sp.]
MTRLKILGAAALLAAVVATPAMAQTFIQEPGAYRQNHAWGNDYDDRYRRSGFWPGEVAAGVVAGAVGTAGAIATAPFRNSNAYYDGPAYGDSYYVERRASRRPACGIQPGATYMGPDGRWYPC